MGGVAVDSKSSPRRSAIEKAQEDLRQEYDVREARRRELEFLEKGGNPLDFKLEKVASLSVQSTSLNITSEAKESYAPHGGDSVESSGPNMADNISLLDGDNSNAGSQIIIKNVNNNNSVGGTVGTKDEEPGILRFARRNRTRSSNVGTRSGTVGIVGSTKVEREKEKEKEKEKEAEKEKDELIVVSDSVPANEDAKEDDLKVASETVQEPETGTIETVEKTEETGTGIGTGTVGEGTSNNSNTEMDIDVVNAGTKGEIGITGTGTDGLTENVGTGTEQKDELKDKEKEFDQPVPVQVDQVEKSKGKEKDEKEEKDEKSKTELNDVEMEDVTEIEKSKELETTVSENTVVPPTEEELKAQKKEYEDSVLKQAKLIEANHRKACEIPSSKLPLEKRRKCHWDFVLEEMAWLANDFMQERLWKISAANQASNWVKGGICKFEELNLIKKQRNIARVLSKSVIKFWHSVDEERKQGVKKEENNNSDLKKGPIGIKSYAIRVLEMNKSGLIEPPKTPERNRQPGNIIVLEQIPLERLFYTVPAGAIQAYRESIESQYSRSKKNDNNTTNHEDCETSNSIADTRMENAYEEDEVQTSSYKYKNTNNINNNNIKKRKHGRLQDPSPHSPLSLSKRQVSNSNSPNILRIPTKRVRTNIQTGRKIPILKTEVSSDNNSAEREREREREGLLRECESFNNNNSNNNKRGLLDDDVMPAQQRRFDDELAIKSKKKKKQKVFGDGAFGNNNEINVGPSSKNSMYEHGSRGQADNLMHHDQKDHVKKRMESHHFDSNSNNISYGQPGVRKPKMLNVTSAIQETGPTLMLPLTSSQNNMSNPKQLIKFVNSNRDRANIARKGKGIKLVGGNAGSNWSSFEDQALVVLVHDLGPNWELISDMINNTLHFKCVYKRSKECKERHKFLMDKNSDGADSAEDSGTSSQPYPSTLPGIPKLKQGSARQLFQRLQGPLEEDTLKSHFEKIISISHKIRPKNSQELKQIQPAHNSHVVALSQVQPNNLSGNILTPLDLCDMAGPIQQEMALTGQIGYPPNNNNNNNGLSSLPGPQSNMTPVMPPHSSPSFSSASTTPSQQRFGGVPRGPADYNNHPGLALPGRSVVPLAGSGPGSPNVRVVGNGSGLIRGMSPRPGFQRLSPMSGPGTGVVGGIRPQMLRPVQNMEEQQHNRLLIDHHHLQLQQQNPNPTIQSQSATSPSPLNSPAHHLLSNHPSPHQHPSFRFSKQLPNQRMVSPGQQQSLMTSAQQNVVVPGQQNFPEGSGMVGVKKQKPNPQMRQSGSSSNNSIVQKGGGMKGGRILIHQTQQPVSSNINNNNVSNKMYGPVSSSSGMGVSRIGAPGQQAVDQQISDNNNNQEGISGNEMLIGQRHGNNNNNNQQGKNNSTINNNNMSNNRGGVYPSNSGAG